MAKKKFTCGKSLMSRQLNAVSCVVIVRKFAKVLHCKKQGKRTENFSPIISPEKLFKWYLQFDPKIYFPETSFKSPSSETFTEFTIEEKSCENY